MEGYVTGDVTAVLKAAGAERPGVRFCHPSANTRSVHLYKNEPSFKLEESYDIMYSRLGEHSKPSNLEDDCTRLYTLIANQLDPKGFGIDTYFFRQVLPL